MFDRLGNKDLQNDVIIEESQENDILIAEEEEKEEKGKVKIKSLSDDDLSRDLGSSED